jgi:DNA-binding transcriptional ArsR family regulator
MRVDGRAISMAVFTLSAFVLASKFLVPTTMQIFIQGEFITMKQIPNIYTVVDMIIVSVFSCIIGISATYLLFLEPILRNKHSDQSLDTEPVGNLTTHEMPVATGRNNLDIVLKTLKGKEQIIINELIDTGEINQSELSSRTRIPSSTLSRTLYDLEQRGLIVRYYNGMSKMVKLNDSLARDESRI